VDIRCDLGSKVDDGGFDGHDCDLFLRREMVYVVVFRSQRHSVVPRGRIQGDNGVDCHLFSRHVYKPAYYIERKLHQRRVGDMSEGLSTLQ